MSVRRLLMECDARELAEWEALHRHIEPIGGERGDLNAGVIASVIANQWRKEGTKPASPTEYMPDFDKPPTVEPMSVDQMKVTLQSHAALFKTR